MNDTHPDIAAVFEDLIMKRTCEQRLLMGFSMYDAAREIVQSALYNSCPRLKDSELKKGIFLRFYGPDFGPADREKILSYLG